MYNVSYIIKIVYNLDIYIKYKSNIVLGIHCILNRVRNAMYSIFGTFEMETM